MSVRRWIALSVLLLVSAVAALGVGAAALTPAELIGAILGRPEAETARAILFDIRLPRILAALLVGGALAVAGTVLQATFANPLIEPSLVGISGAAGVGAIALAGLLATTSTTVGALGAVLLSAAAMWWLGRSRTRGSRFVLLGIAWGSLATGLIAMAASIPSLNQGRSLTAWVFGSLALATNDQLPLLVVSALAGLALLWRQALPLDIVALGAQSAHYLGVRVEAKRRRWLIAASLLVAPTVALFGVIGFVGLVVPHVWRLLGVVRHRELLPLTAASGGLLVLIADSLARTVAGATEIPVGVVLSVLGAPMLLWLLRRSADA